MENTPEALRDRTKDYAIRIIHLFRALPARNKAAQIIGTQLLRSGTAIGANYRAAGRGRSRAEFAAKLGIVVEEADETIYWIELLPETDGVKKERLTKLLQEAKELAAFSPQPSVPPEAGNIHAVAKERRRQARNSGTLQI